MPTLRFRYVRSAELFAETATPFEEVALRFSQTSVLAGAASSTRGGAGGADAASPEIAAGVALTEDYFDGASEDDTLSSPSLIQATASAPMGINLQLLTPSTPLKAFLRAKLRLLDEKGKAVEGQAAIVAVWLIELLLGEIGLLEERCAKPGAPAVRAEELAKVRTEFRQLVGSPIVTVSPAHNPLLTFSRIPNLRRFRLNSVI